MAKLRIGLIGFGAWVQSAYLPALEHDGRAKVAAVTASSEKTRQRARQILGDETAVFGDYTEMLERARLDAVMIAVPDSVHQAALAAVLDAGIPVFYEPPVSHLRRQIPVVCGRLLKSEQVTFAHLELGRHPAVTRAANLVKDGAVGRLQTATVTLNAGWGCAEDSDLSLIGRMSCWYVDVLNRIVGAVPKRVLVLDGHGSPGRMQPAATGVYDYGGTWGFFKANVASRGELSITIEIEGDAGKIAIDYFSGTLRYQGILNAAPGEAPSPVCEDCSPWKPYADYPAVHETVTAFLDAVVTGNASQGNVRDVAQLCLLGLAAEESKDSGTWAAVPTLESLLPDAELE